MGLALLFGGMATLGLVLSASGMIKVYNVPTGNMSPTMNPGDTIVMEGISLLGQDLERGRIYAFSTDGIEGLEKLSDYSQIYLKRLVGLPGDVLVVKDKKLLINDKPASDYFESPVTEYVFPGPEKETDLSKPFTIPAGHVFFLGDNVSNSYDSRFWGPAPVENVRQRYLMHLRRGPVLPPGPRPPPPFSR